MSDLRIAPNNDRKRPFVRDVLLSLIRIMLKMKFIDPSIPQDIRLEFAATHADQVSLCHLPNQARKVRRRRSRETPMSRLTRIELHCFRHRLAMPMQTVFGRVDSRPALLVRVEDEDGAEGWARSGATFRSPVRSTARDWPRSCCQGRFVD